MLLCNLNQTVITASSDRTIHAWSPHSPSAAPSLIGRHRDYVKSLAWAKYPSLLFSGALDRQVAIWDVGAGHHETPLLSIDLNKADEWGGVGLEGERGSVYALGVDPTGRILAAGTPERVVRLWDPRVGDKTIAKLVGHSDCVRSVIVSEDGKHMLTGSSDSTIKLWSLAAHRCLHTFNHHTSSVWSLFSNHPNLERFYSGSRDGILCAVDVEQVGDISDGECVVLAREGYDESRKGDYESKSGDEGVRCIVGMDDEFVWTATGSSEIKRWRDVGRRVTRKFTDDVGASYHVSVPGLDQPFSPVPTDGALRNKRLSLEVDTPLIRTESRDSQTRTVAFAPPPNPREASSPGNNNNLSPGSFSRERSNDGRRTTLSGASIAGSVMSDASGLDEQQSGLNGIPYDSLVCLGIQDSPYSFGFGHHAHRSGDIPDGASGQARADGDGRPRARDEYEDREVASEAKPLRLVPDEVIAGRPGLVRSIILNDRQHVLTVDTEGEVGVWNIVKGQPVGRFSPADVAAALDLERGVDPETAVRKHSVEVLELVRDRIEGETMVITWCAVDTRIGSLVVHLEEGRVFDAEVYADESGVQEMQGAREDLRRESCPYGRNLSFVRRSLQSTSANGRSRTCSQVRRFSYWCRTQFLTLGLIRAEEREVISNRDGASLSPATTLSSLPSSIPRSPEIRGAPIDRGQSGHPHRKRALTGSFSSQGPPVLNIPGLAVPAARAAVVPDEEILSKSAPVSSTWQSFHALRSGPLPAIAQSPAVSLGGSATATSPLESSGGRGDYFSLNRRKDPSPSRGERDKEPPTPGSVTGLNLSTGTPATTPGGSKLGKLKFGKKKKPEAQMSPVVETKELIPEEDKVK
jgi:WD repeat-containing protein 48